MRKHLPGLAETIHFQGVNSMAIQTILPEHQTCKKCGVIKPLALFKRYSKTQPLKGLTWYTDRTCKRCIYERDQALIKTRHPTRRKKRTRFLDHVSGCYVKECRVCGCVKPLNAFRLTHAGGSAKLYPSDCKRCHSARTSKRTPAQKIKNAAQARQYYYRDHEGSIKKSREKYARNREGILARAKVNDRAKAKNRERTKSAYHAKSLKERQALARRRYDYVRQWAREHRENMRASRAARRARKKAAQVEKIDPELIIARDASTCYLWCKQVLSRNEICLDHIVPLSRGGIHATDNLRVSCRSCNSRKGSRLLSELTGL